MGFHWPQMVSMGIEHLKSYNPHSIVSGYAVKTMQMNIRVLSIIY